MRLTNDHESLRNGLLKNGFQWRNFRTIDHTIKNGVFRAGVRTFALQDVSFRVPQQNRTYVLFLFHSKGTH